MTRIGIVGFGFMGRTHLRAYAEDGRASVVAVAEADAARVQGAAGGNIEGAADETTLPADVRVHPTLEAMLEAGDLDAVSICVPTPLHAETAIAALEADVHVLLEKPVALTSVDGRKIEAVAAARPDLVCMPAMCMRFWPGWRWLKERIADGRYGPVRSAVFTRLGARPGWGSGFYDDAARSGGAILDLHIHDADFVRYCFGDPAAVESAAARGPGGGLDHVSTRYRYDEGPTMVVAEGAWMSAPGYPFSMRYRVDFESVTADFDIGRMPPVVLHDTTGAAVAIELPAGDGYRHEIAHFLDCIETGTPSGVVTIADGVEAVRLIEREREAARRR